jgi:hypothetical protein
MFFKNLDDSCESGVESMFSDFELNISEKVFPKDFFFQMTHTGF